jgi:hypothetical protein
MPRENLPKSVPALRLISLALALSVGAAAPRVARAEAAGDSAIVREGQEHVRRGLELYEEGDLNGAHAELERAYQIAPAFKILYNLAQISLRRQDWVTAKRELGAYLSEGKGSLSAGRVREVEDTLARLAARTGVVEVAGAVTGARLLVDDADEVPLPLPKPLVVNVGRHVATVVWPGGERDSKSFEIAGGDRLALEFAAPVAHEMPRPRDVPRAATQARLDLSPPSVDADEDAVLVRRRAYDAQPRKKGSASHSSSSSSGAWIAWTATALVTAGAGATGVLAIRSSRELANDRTSYPIDQTMLADESTRTRRYSLGADALAITAVALAGLSIYLSVRGSD